jgi:hypothetical protein
MGWVHTNRLYINEELENLRGYYRDDTSWNGWAVVALPRETIQFIIDTQDADPDSEWWYREVATWDGDTLVVHDRLSAEEDPKYQDERLSPVMVSGEQTWALGSRGWVWSVDEEGES